MSSDTITLAALADQVASLTTTVSYIQQTYDTITDDAGPVSPWQDWLSKTYAVLLSDWLNRHALGQRPTGLEAAALGEQAHEIAGISWYAAERYKSRLESAKEDF